MKINGSKSLSAFGFLSLWIFPLLAAPDPEPGPKPDADRQSNGDAVLDEVRADSGTDDDPRSSRRRPARRSRQEQRANRPSALARRVTTPPRIDGDLSDPVWSEAEPAGGLVQVHPDTGAPPTERTVFRIVYDDDYLYVNLHCYDREPNKILATEMARDGRVGADDYVSLVFDTFHDRRNAYFFRVNPNGARYDALVSNNSDFNENWDGIWTAAASTDDSGWKAEIAIPFKTLSFDPKISTWGFNIERNIKRKFERARWAGAHPDFSITNVSEAGDLTGLRGLKQGVGLDIVPYALGRYTLNNLPREGSSLQGEFGGDVRYRVTPNLLASLSVNTDFAETEADARQVNLTRFPLFFPEKRSFFLEDSGIFDFANTSSSTVLPFFSRRIGLGNTSEPVSILSAAKVSGRVGDYNIGAIDAVLESHDNLDVKNAFVTRLSKNVFEQSTVGMITTIGDPNSDVDNFMGGLDFNYRTSDAFGDQLFKASVYGLSSYTEGLEGSDNLTFGAAVSMPNDLWDWNLGFTQVEDNFNAALGFVPRTGIRRYVGGTGYNPRPDHDLVRQLFFFYRGTYFTDLSNEVDTAQHRIFPLLVLFESGDEIYFETRWQFDSPDAPFEISEGVVIPFDDYWWNDSRVGFETASKRPVEFEADYRWGEFYHGDREEYDFDLVFKPSKFYRITLGHELNKIRLPAGDFDTRIAKARLQLNFNPDLVWFNLVQYDSVSDTIGVNSRIFWEFRPGARLFLVLNQNYDRDRGEPTLIQSKLTTKINLTLRF